MIQPNLPFTREIFYSMSAIPRGIVARLMDKDVVIVLGSWIVL